MTLVSRDMLPPRTPHEAELRERVAELQGRVAFFQQIIVAQDRVVAAAREAWEYFSVRLDPEAESPSMTNLGERLSQLEEVQKEILGQIFKKKELDDG